MLVLAAFVIVKAAVDRNRSAADAQAGLRCHCMALCGRAVLPSSVSVVRCTKTMNHVLVGTVAHRQQALHCTG